VLFSALLVYQIHVHLTVMPEPPSAEEIMKPATKDDLFWVRLMASGEARLGMQTFFSAAMLGVFAGMFLMHGFRLSKDYVILDM